MILDGQGVHLELLELAEAEDAVRHNMLQRHATAMWLMFKS